MIRAKYGENIIVAFKYQNQYSWYISDLELWYINYEEAGYNLDQIDKEITLSGFTRLRIFSIFRRYAKI